MKYVVTKGFHGMPFILRRPSLRHCSIRCLKHNLNYCMPSNSQRLAAAFALTFLVGGVTGYFAGNRNPAATATTNRELDSGDPSARLQPRTETSGEPERGDLGSPSVAALPNADIPRRILAAVRARDYFRRRHEIYAVGQLLDRETIRSAMEATQQFPDTDRENAQYALVARWLELDAAAAYEWVRAVPGQKRRTELMREFFHSLGLKDPTTALSFLTQYGVDPNRDEDFTHSVFDFSRSVVDSDPEGAVAWAATISQPAQRDSTIGEVFRQWKRTDRKAAEAWLHATPALTKEARERMLRWND
jgi:hypothetical protein